MLPRDPGSLRAWLTTAGFRSVGFVYAAGVRLALDALLGGSGLSVGLDRLAGRSVVLAARDPLVAASALVELDGVVRRLVLCPPDLPLEQIAAVAAAAEADVIVGDRTAGPTGGFEYVTGSRQIAPVPPPDLPFCETEWVLLTSGTTALPKLVVHRLSTLTDAIRAAGRTASQSVWSTFYDIRRYGGLQILLRAILGGGSLVLSSPAESTAAFLARAGSCGVTHISGTPSHWRRALMSPAAHLIRPQYIRLSGEIADQAILDRLHDRYPAAAIAHAFASTEAGVAFEVKDSLAGFPAYLVEDRAGDVTMRIEDGSLRLRSSRTALGYIGIDNGSLADAEGFVDTGDIVERRGDRYYFVGRRGGIVNVGGFKVHPEEIEAVINRHPRVEASLVRARKNPITGAIVAVDVVAAETGTAAAEIEALKVEILGFCRRELARYKVPAVIRFVPSLDLAASGKLARRDA